MRDLMVTVLNSEVYTVNRTERGSVTVQVLGVTTLNSRHRTVDLQLRRTLCIHSTYVFFTPEAHVVFFDAFNGYIYAKISGAYETYMLGREDKWTDCHFVYRIDPLTGWATNVTLKSTVPDFAIDIVRTLVRDNVEDILELTDHPLLVSAADGRFFRRDFSAIFFGCDLRRRLFASTNIRYPEVRRLYSVETGAYINHMIDAGFAVQGVLPAYNPDNVDIEYFRTPFRVEMIRRQSQLRRTSIISDSTGQMFYIDENLDLLLIDASNLKRIYNFGRLQVDDDEVQPRLGLDEVRGLLYVCNDDGFLKVFQIKVSPQALREVL